MMSALLTVSVFKDMQGMLHTWSDQIVLSLAGKWFMQMCSVGQKFKRHAAPLRRKAAQNIFLWPLGMGMRPSVAYMMSPMQGCWFQ